MLLFISKRNHENVFMSISIIYIYRFVLLTALRGYQDEKF